MSKKTKMAHSLTQSVSDKVTYWAVRWQLTTYITHVTQRNSCIIPITQVGHVELHSIGRRPPFCCNSLMACSALPPRASKLVSLTKSNWLGHPPRFVPPNMQPTHNYPSICSLNCIGVILKEDKKTKDKKTKRQKDKKTKRQKDKKTKVLA